MKLAEKFEENLLNNSMNAMFSQILGPQIGVSQQPMQRANSFNNLNMQQSGWNQNMQHPSANNNQQWNAQPQQQQQPQAVQPPNPNNNGQGDCWALNANSSEKIVPYNSTISQNLLVIEAKLNDHTLDILIDSGSNRTVISNQLASKLGIPISPLNQVCGATGIGGQVQFIGKANISLTIANITRQITVLVAKHGDIFDRTVFMALIGYGTLKLFPPFILDARSDKMTMNAVDIPIGDPRASKYQIFKVQAEQSIVLKAGMQTKVSVTTSGNQHTKRDGLRIESASQEMQNKEVDVVQAIISADNSPAVIFLNNPTQKDIQIYEGTTLAHAIPIVNEQSDNNGTVFSVRDTTNENDHFIGYCQGFQ